MAKKNVGIHSSTYGTFTFLGVNELNHPIDDQFYHLYAMSAPYLQAGGQINASTLFTEDFIKNSVEYFNTKTAQDGSNSVSVGDMYIENLTVLPNCFHDKGDLRASYSIWLAILKLLYGIEETTSSVMHKGTAYYFAGGNALEMKDFESGMLMMHLALKDDERNNPNWQSTPAYAFMTIDTGNVEQFHRPLVEAMAKIIKNRLTDSNNSYTRTGRGNISYQDFRRKFLQNDQYIPSGARYYFVYSLLRFWHMRVIHKSRIMDEIISPLVFGNAMGSLLLVVETLLKYVLSPQDEKTLATLVESLGLGVSCGTLKQRKAQIGFESLLVHLIGQGNIKGDFEVAYLCRNQIFHVIENENIYVDHHTEIAQSIFNCIFYIIENKY